MAKSKTPTVEVGDVVDVTRGVVVYRNVWIREIKADGTIVGSYRSKLRESKRVSFKASEVTAFYHKILSRYGG